MGVLTREEHQNQREGPGGVELTKCFLCGKDLFNDDNATGGIVYWVGPNQQVALHQGCAEHLGVHLIQDARSCVRIVGIRSQLTHLPPKQSESLWFMKK